MNKTPKIVEQVVSKDETVVVQQVVEQMMKEQEAAEKKADIQSIFSRKCTVKDPVSNLWFHEDVETDDDIKFGDNLGGDVVDEGQQGNRVGGQRNSDDEISLFFKCFSGKEGQGLYHRQELMYRLVMR